MKKRVKNQIGKTKAFCTGKKKGMQNLGIKYLYAICKRLLESIPSNAENT